MKIILTLLAVTIGLCVSSAQASDFTSLQRSQDLSHWHHHHHHHHHGTVVVIH